MEELDKLIEAFEEVVDKLNHWYDYYSEEDLLKPANANIENIGENMGKHIKSLKNDVMLLKIAATVIKLNETAKSIIHD